MVRVISAAELLASEVPDSAVEAAAFAGSRACAVLLAGREYVGLAVPGSSAR